MLCKVTHCAGRQYQGHHDYSCISQVQVTFLTGVFQPMQPHCAGRQYQSHDYSCILKYKLTGKSVSTNAAPLCRTPIPVMTTHAFLKYKLTGKSVSTNAAYNMQVKKSAQSTIKKLSRLQQLLFSNTNQCYKPK